MSRRPWRAVASLVVLASVMALNNVDRGLFALLLPEIKKSIPLNDTLVGLLLGPAFMVVYSIAGLPLAWFADRWNRRNLIAAGLACWSVITAITGAATRPLHLLLLRGALGIGEATNVPSTTALVSDLFPARQRALAFAVIAIGTPLGTLLCFPLAGDISASDGWRTAFLAMGLIGIAVAVTALLVVWEPRSIPVAVMAAQPRVAIVRGLSAEFARALRSRSFRVLVIAGVFLSCNYSAMTVWLPEFLSRTHGLSIQQIGATLGLYRGAFGIPASLLGGGIVALTARRDERWIAWVPAAFCMLIVPAELVLLLSKQPDWWHWALGLETFCLTAAIPCTFALLAHVVDPAARAVWSACYFLAFNLVGQSLGPYCVGQLSTWLQPSLAMHSLQFALLLGPLCIGGAGLMFARVATAMHVSRRPGPGR